jgi:very-short-patch-repair endonuclease
MKPKHAAKYLARKLRRESTHAEKILWERLRNRKFFGLKFYRQKYIIYTFNKEQRFFIADFYCHHARLIIEVDGPVHNKQKDYDQARTELLEAVKYNVIRFSNNEIENDIESVLQKLKSTIDKYCV